MNLFMINDLTVQGRLTINPELRATTNGTNVTTFQVASERNYKNQDGEYVADFIDVVAWKGLAEFITKNFHKGDLILVRGRVETRNYKDKHDAPRKTVQLKADEVSFCGYRKEKETNPVYQKEAENTPLPYDDFEPIEDEDNPF